MGLDLFLSRVIAFIAPALSCLFGHPLGFGLYSAKLGKRGLPDLASPAKLGQPRLPDLTSGQISGTSRKSFLPPGSSSLSLARSWMGSDDGKHGWLFS